MWYLLGPHLPSFASQAHYNALKTPKSSYSVMISQISVTLSVLRLFPNICNAALSFVFS